MTDEKISKREIKVVILAMAVLFIVWAVTALYVASGGLEIT